MSEGKINEIQVSVLKKRKRRQVAEAKELRDQLKGSRRPRNKVLRKKVFRRAEEFVLRDIRKLRDHRKLKQQIKGIARAQDISEDTKPKLCFVLRLANDKEVDMCSVTKKALLSLRLLVKNQGTFVVLSQEVKKALEISQRFITWGEPSLRTVRELLLKRGYIRDYDAVQGTKASKPIPLMDNTLIEKHLGSVGVICVEDVVHEIFSTGDNFDAVNNFVGKFHLSDPPREDMERVKYAHFDAGGRYGYRGDKINALVQAMI